MLFTISDERNLLSNQVNIKEFAHFLGYSVEQGREIIDQAYSELYPAYSIFYSDQRAAGDIVDRFQALHLLYRIETGTRVRQFTGGESNIVQMPLTVRYLLRGTKPTTTDLYRVRCKLNIPSYTASTPFFEYDGYITLQRYDTHYWLFENRSQENKDLIFMITDSLQIIRQHHEGTHKEYDYTQGVMLTRRQDAWPIHKVWKIVMLKIDQESTCANQPKTFDSESSFMTGQCKVVPEEDVPSWIVDTLRQDWKGIEVY